MNKLFLSIFFCFAVIFFIPLVNAVTPSDVSLQGRVLSSTCSIDINGGKDATVSLPALKVSDFKDKTSHLQKEQFTINLSNCSDVGNDALFLTITRPSIGETKTSVPATAGSAKDSVEFVLEDVVGKGPAWVFDGLTAKFKSLPLVNGNVSMTYSVAYRALKIPVSAGTITSNIKVEVTYK